MGGGLNSKTDVRIYSRYIFWCFVCEHSHAAWQLLHSFGQNLKYKTVDENQWEMPPSAIHCK